MNRILLLGAGGNAARNFAASLRMADTYWVMGVDTHPQRLLAAPLDERLLLPSSCTLEERIATLNSAIAAHGIEFVHAQPDSEVEFLLRSRDSISTAVFGHDLDMWAVFADKYACTERWQSNPELGMPQYALNDLLSDERLADELLQESGRMWIRARQGAGSRAALPVTRVSEARSWSKYWIHNRGLGVDDFVLTPWLPGPEYAVQMLWRDGQCVQAQARERLEYVFAAQMASGQSSTPSLARTVSMPHVTAAAVNAVVTIDPSPHGIYCVDLKTSASGHVKPLEVNYGRFFTTTDFFARLGVNGPHAYVQIAAGREVEPQIDAIRSTMYWVRGLDHEPALLTDADLEAL